MEPKIRTAQTNLTCAKCGKTIKIGHPYVWRRRILHRLDMGEPIHMERVHLECYDNTL